MYSTQCNYMISKETLVSLPNEEMFSKTALKKMGEALILTQGRVGDSPYWRLSCTHTRDAAGCAHIYTMIPPL